MFVAFSLVVVACLGLASAAAAAGTEIQRPTEKIDLYFAPGGHFRVSVTIDPLRGVAVIWTEKNLNEAERPGGRWGSVVYATHIPTGPADGRLDLEIPGLGWIVGELIPVEPPKTGSPRRGCVGPRWTAGTSRFDGSFHFTGAGGYLSFDTDHAQAWVKRSPTFRCKEGFARNPRGHRGLFGYFHSELGFSNQESMVLFSTLTTRHRISNFMATREWRHGLATFKAQTFEWLPGRVAAERLVEASKVESSRFVTSSEAKHPAAATIHPPRPFSGVGVFSHARGTLTGSLSVQFLGKRVRLGSRHSQANLANLDASGVGFLR